MESIGGHSHDAMLFKPQNPNEHVRLIYYIKLGLTQA